MTEMGTWAGWASPLAWTVGTLLASWLMGHVLGAVLMSRVARWLAGRQHRLTVSALQLLRQRLPWWALWRGAFKVTKRISSPPRLEDFAELRLPDEDLSDLRTCRVGDCELKLGERPLMSLRAEVDWTKSDAPLVANTIMRRFAHQYVMGYLDGGNDRLAVYRDNSRPTFVGREFRAMVGEMPSLTTYWPNMRRYLLGYPKASLPGSTSFLYWQEAQFGLKPTIRINHLVIREAAEDTVVASKMLYASHYFWTAIELRVLIPDPSRGPGFWFVTVNRSRSDGLSGFSGFFIRGRVQNEAQNGALAILRLTKSMLEESP